MSIVQQQAVWWMTLSCDKSDRLHACRRVALRTISRSRYPKLFTKSHCVCLMKQSNSGSEHPLSLVFVPSSQWSQKLPALFHLLELCQRQLQKSDVNMRYERQDGLSRPNLSSRPRIGCPCCDHDLIVSCASGRLPATLKVTEIVSLQGPGQYQIQQPRAGTSIKRAGRLSLMRSVCGQCAAVALVAGGCMIRRKCK